MARAVNLSAGCAALPVEVMQRAQREFVEFVGQENHGRALPHSQPATEKALRASCRGAREVDSQPGFFRRNDGKPRGLSINEMGYRTTDFYEMMETAGPPPPPRAPLAPLQPRPHAHQAPPPPLTRSATAPNVSVSPWLTSHGVSAWQRSVSGS